MFYEKLLKRSKQIDLQLNTIQQNLNKLPNGDLHCTHNGPYIKWFNHYKGNITYIPKKSQGLAEQLAIRKYLSTLIAELKNEQDSIDAYINCINKYRGHADKLLQEDSCFQSLLTPYFSSHNKDIADWLSEPYETNLSHPEHLIHKTIAGYFVRSKSESLITSALYTNHIPFRYECALHLGEITLFPDFTILHPKTHNIYYWEHFGMMNNSDYTKASYKKLQLYSEHDIIPSRNLIMTFETPDNPLDYETIDHTIQFYFR